MTDHALWRCPECGNATITDPHINRDRVERLCLNCTALSGTLVRRVRASAPRPQPSRQPTSPRPSSDIEQAVIDAYTSNDLASIRSVSAQFDMPTSRVGRILRNAGVTRPQGRRIGSISRTFLTDDERAAIAAAYQADPHITYAEIGRQYGVTREAIRLVLAKAGVPGRGRGQKGSGRPVRHGQLMPRGWPLRPDDTDVRTEIMTAVVAADGSTATAAEQLGVSVSTVQRVLALPENQPIRDQAAEMYRRALSAGSRRRTVTVTNDEMIACLREAATLVDAPIMSGVQYEDVARSREFADGRPWPLRQSISQRYGTWNNAMDAAGLPHHESSPVLGRREFTDDDVLAALREAAALVGHPPSCNEYDRIARESTGRLPSLALIRGRDRRRPWVEWMDMAASRG